MHRQIIRQTHSVNSSCDVDVMAQLMAAALKLEATGCSISVLEGRETSHCPQDISAGWRTAINLVQTPASLLA